MYIRYTYRNTWICTNICVYMIYMHVIYITYILYLFIFFISVKDPQRLVPASAQETSHVASDDIMKASSAKTLRLPSICPPHWKPTLEKSDGFSMDVWIPVDSWIRIFGES